MAKAMVTAPYQKAWSRGDAVKVPTSGGSTGMISPTDTMSISTVSMMNGIAGWRPGAAGAADSGVGGCSRPPLGPLARGLIANSRRHSLR
jgi:hypothetical protein